MKQAYTYEKAMCCCKGMCCCMSVMCHAFFEGLPVR